MTHLRVAAIAERLQVSTGHVRALIRRGELPAVRIGRAVRVSEAALATFLAAHRLAPVMPDKGKDKGKDRRRSRSAARTRWLALKAATHGP
jgi:excisionase family DNA binding protein